jgi:hypothetical protein
LVSQLVVVAVLVVLTVVLVVVVQFVMMVVLAKVVRFGGRVCSGCGGDCAGYGDC